MKNISTDVLKFINTKFARFLCIAPKAPSVVHIEITKKCNLRCKTCDLWKYYIKNPNLVKSELTTKDLVSLAGQLARIGVAVVAITGGEPSLRKDLVEIVQAFKKYGMVVHITTNGSISLEQIQELAKAGIDSISVSIDYFGKKHDESRGVHGTFDRAIRTLRNLKQAGIKKICMGVLLMGQNSHHLEKLAKLAKELDIFISFTGFDLGVLKENKNMKRKRYQNFIGGIDTVNKLRKRYDNIIVLPAYLDYMKKQILNPKKINWCYAGFATCIIEANGNVRPCYQLPPVGNLKENRFIEIWRSSKMQRMRKTIKRGCNTICFAHCTIEPSIVFNNPIAALQFYKSKWSRIVQNH